MCRHSPENIIDTTDTRYENKFHTGNTVSWISISKKLIIEYFHDLAEYSKFTKYRSPQKFNIMSSTGTGS
jgi:hypothetical protein